MATSLMTSYINGIKSGVSIIRSVAMNKCPTLTSTAKLSQIVTALESIDTTVKTDTGCAWIFDTTASTTRNNTWAPTTPSYAGYTSYVAVTIPFGRNPYTTSWGYNCNYETTSRYVGDNSNIYNNVTRVAPGRYMNYDGGVCPFYWQRQSLYLPKCSYIGDYAFYDSPINWVSNGLASCKTIGQYAFYSGGNFGPDTYPPYPLYLSSCSYIGSSAFYCRKSLPSAITIGTLTSNITIGSNAFYSCTSSYKYITIGSSATQYINIGSSAFYSDQSCIFNILGGTGAPLNVAVGSCAFYGCNSLANINFIKYIKTINASTFWSCTSILSLPSLVSATIIGSSAFAFCSKMSGTVSLPVCSLIREYAFYGCSSITSLYVSSTTAALTLSNFAFCNCYSLSSIFIGGASTYISVIGNNAFYGCSSLNYITTGTGSGMIWGTTSYPLKIGDYAFYNCLLSGQSYISIDNCYYIGNCAFYNTKMSSLFIWNNNTTTGSLSMITIGTYAFYSCTNLSNLTIEATNVEISHYAFANCKKIGYGDAPICVPSYVSRTLSIHSYAFASAFATDTTKYLHIMSTNIASNYSASAYIYSYAFAYNSYISFVSFGPNTTYKSLMANKKININGYGHFSGCYRLSGMWFACGSVPALPASIGNIFSSTPYAGYNTYATSGYIYVPSSLYSAWITTTNWATIATKISSYTVS